MGTIESYFEYLEGIVEQTGKTQAANIAAAADLVVESHLSGNGFFVFGSGHSHMIAEELYMRAGGLAFVKAILPPELMLHEMPMKSTLLERLPGYADALLELYMVRKGDTLLVASNSGINNVPVEMALGAKERGARVIALTSLKHSQGANSRHQSGKRLFEIADVVLDNQAQHGDAAFMVAGCETPTGPISDFVGMAIAQALVVRITEKLVEKGEEVPLFRSSNMNNADDFNARYYEKYFPRRTD